MQRGLVGSEMCIRDRYMEEHDSLTPIKQEEIDESLPETINNYEPIYTQIRSKLIEDYVNSDLDMALDYKKYVDNNFASPTKYFLAPVSYTHLTLPTILLVQISVVAVSLKKKKNKLADYRHKWNI
eukprot:TRINITY_DN38571_c0_g1_i2.p2 TRINITY_DN38571_c0_g1~~TRINITY_DN38571_c0_g1_i2.p2  ORF type:complete len:126 (+),score=42.10 TRINITY_DN38571_c0_g1_i2:114-491(+)